MVMLLTSSTVDSRCILIPAAQQETSDSPEKSSYMPQAQTLSLPHFQVNRAWPTLTVTLSSRAGIISGNAILTSWGGERTSQANHLVPHCSKVFLQEVMKAQFFHDTKEFSIFLFYTKCCPNKTVTALDEFEEF